MNRLLILLAVVLLISVCFAHLLDVMVLEITVKDDHTELRLDTGQVLVVDAVWTNEVPLPSPLVYKQNANTNWLIFAHPFEGVTKIAIPPLKEQIQYEAHDLDH